MSGPLRGQVFRADLGFGSKPWVVVSNNARNRITADVLAVRVTTTRRELPTWVELGPADPLHGFVNTDNIETIARDELGDYLGALSGGTINRMNAALAIALGMA